MTPAIAQARAAGIDFRVHELTGRNNSRSARKPVSAIEEVAALGLPLERVFKTLVAKLDGATVVTVVMPVSCRLDLERLAAAAGARRAAMVIASQAERATGYPLGAISPLGQRQRLPVFIDESAFAFPSIYISGGRRGIEIELAPAALRDVCNGRTVRVAEANPRNRKS
jgi:Cys-tRNA(Pro)/Cys-tRNA(Cys) deacylase